MNRQIKFRVWDSMNNKWLFGYNHKNLGGFSMFGEVIAFNEWSNILAKYSISEWDKLKISQYSGIKDKTGKEIYEGDLIHYKSSNNGRNFKSVIEFYKGCFINRKISGKSCKSEYSTFLLTNEANLTVIGNIYDSESTSNLK